MTTCLFTSSSSTLLANIGSSLPITISFLLVATFLTLSISPIVVADRRDRITVLAPKLFVVALMSVAAIFTAAFFLLPASVISRVRHQEGRAGRASVSRAQLLATFIRQNVVIVGILLFYIIGVVPDLLRVINESMCWQAWSQCSTLDVCAAHHVDVFNHSVRVILTSMIVLMCWSFRGVVMCRNLFVTLALATFAAAMSCLWFDKLLTELIENLRHDNHNMTGIVRQIADSDDDYHNDDDDAEGIYNRTRACRAHNTTINNLLERYERFFYPCTFEFALLVIHCVVQWYITSEYSSLSSRQQVTETSALLSYGSVDESSVSGEDDINVTSHPDSSVGMRRRCAMLLIITTVLVNVVYCLLSLLAVYAHMHHDNNLFYIVYIWYEMFYRALISIVLLVGLVVAGSSRSSRPDASTRQSHGGVEYLVLFTSCVPFIKSIFSIIAYSRGSADWITVSVKTVNVLGQTLAIFHVAIQTVFVFYAKNFRRPELTSVVTRTSDYCSRHRSQFRAVLLVVALCNTTFWATDSFVEINLAYGPYWYRCSFFSYWGKFISFTVPIAIFYYFNSALLCLDVFLNC